MSEASNKPGPILHVIVIGFHHKRGCQVEYAFPPLTPGGSVDSHDLPLEWKYLSSLALPDGSHNYTKDTVYFHLPSREDPKRTVFGVSCYRQIDVSELRKRQADVTRNSIQKCVCVISTLPLFGLIQAKLALITHAYFKEGDFSQVSLLEDTFTSLNASLNDSQVEGTQVFLGLSGREMLQHFKHKALLLFKLVLLERRVLFYSSPVEVICTTMLTLLSWFPGLLEHGLEESASYTPKRLLSPTLKVTKINSVDSEDFLEVHYSSEEGGSVHIEPGRSSRSNSNERLKGLTEEEEHLSLESATDIEKITHVEHIQGSENVVTQQPNRGRHMSDPVDIDLGKKKSPSLQRSFSLQEDDIAEPMTDKQMEELLEAEECFNWDEDKLLLEIDEAIMTHSESNSKTHRHTPTESQSSHSTPVKSQNQNTTHEKSKSLNSTPTKSQSESQEEFPISKDSSNQNLTSSNSSLSIKASTLRERIATSLSKSRSSEGLGKPLKEEVPLSPSSLPADDYGFPLAIFTKGNLCHPYLCLQYHDLLCDVNIRGFFIGATNQLFKQKRHLLDVIIDIAELKLDMHDPELKKQLTLTTADLRFADLLVKSVSEERGNIFLDNTEWEGGDEWLRGQFRMYLLAMLSTVHHGDEKLIEDFNPNFVAAWKTTHNYKLWQASKPSAINSVIPGHPFHGNLGIADMKLRISHSMQSTDRGKKINAAVQQTGKVMANTTKVVGGALNTAKSAVSKTVTSWFGGFGSQDEPEKDLAES